MSEAPGFDPNSPEQRQETQISDELWQATANYVDTIPVASTDFLRSKLASRMISKHVHRLNPDLSDSEIEEMVGSIQTEGTAEAIIEELQASGKLERTAKKGAGFAVKNNTPEAIAERKEKSGGRIDRALSTKFGKQILKPVITQTSQNVTYRASQARTVGRVTGKASASLGRGVQKVTGVSAVKHKLEARTERRREEAELKEWEKTRQYTLDTSPAETPTPENQSDKSVKTTEQLNTNEIEIVAGISEAKLLEIEKLMSDLTVGFLLQPGVISQPKEQRDAELARMRRTLVGVELGLGMNVSQDLVDAVQSRIEAIPEQKRKEAELARQTEAARNAIETPNDTPASAQAEEVPASRAPSPRSLAGRLEKARQEGVEEFLDQATYRKMRSRIDEVVSGLRNRDHPKPPAEILEQARKTVANEIARDRLGTSKGKENPEFYSLRNRLLMNFDEITAAEEAKEEAKRASEQAVADNAARTAIDS